MTSQRSSVRGRGSEILFGAPQAVKIKPLPSRRVPPIERASKPEAGDPESGQVRAAEKAAAPVLASRIVSTPAPATPVRATPAAEDLLAGLAEEARAARVEAPGPENQALPKPAAAAAVELPAAVDLPAPVVATVIPSQEEPMEESVPSTEEGLYEPVPGNGDGLPVSGFVKVAGVESIGTQADIQSTGEPQQPLELPERRLTEEEKQEILARLGSARLQELADEIDAAYDEVLATVGDNADLTTECYNQLLKAREILLLQDAARIPQVEYYIEQVRARLKRATQSNAGAHKYAWLIAAWGLLWCSGFLAVLIALNYAPIRDRFLTGGTASVDMAIFLPAMVWGGIGGVAAVFYSLFKHVGRRDFDAQFNLSYVGKPFLGIILGAIVYMIVHVMIMTLGILPGELAQEGGTIQAGTVTPWIIYFLAWACGFKENRIFDLVDRVMKRIFSGDAGAAAAA